LDGLAQELGVGAIYAKLEAARSPLGSFKMLGAPHALIQLARTIVPEASASELMSGAFSGALKDLTAVCASDGNHGRSLAWAASRLGCRARIYLPESVSLGRADAIAAWGAAVVRVDDNYDAAVRFAAAEAAANGWHVISDTAYAGYHEVPRHIMEGYTLVAEEVIEQFEGAPKPTHVFLQVGCGGMAASLISGLSAGWKGDKPSFVTVEPLTAACLLETAAADSPVVVEGDHQTIMGGLACGEVSEIAWDYLRTTVDHYLAIPDSAALAAMRRLADAAASDPVIVSGETGAAGLGALLMARSDKVLGSALGLGSDSVVLVIITEGATDPAEYERLVGRAPTAVGAAVLEAL
jgi:diaminopropionate ammonia-lyase